MTEAIYFTPAGGVQIRRIDVPAPGPHEIRVMTHVTGVRHGADRRALSAPRAGYPRGWGVGKVVETGAGVRAFAEGDWIHGPMIHAGLQNAPADAMYPLDWLRPEFAVFTDPGAAALRAIHAVGVRYGERVIVSGMGVVGLMALQYAMLSGASAAAIDPLPSRLRVAQRLGARVTAESVNELSHRAGPPFNDACIECTGDDDALLRAAAVMTPGSRLVAGGAGYGAEAMDQACEICARKDALFILPGGLMDQSRLERIAIHSLAAQQVIVWPIISRILHYREAPAAYRCLCDDPAACLKLIFTFDREPDEQ
ncbi:MAG: zinc-binding dehydrogenase [bacterium]|nr:zinc-binding dehydrogenase [bacterium]